MFPHSLCPRGTSGLETRWSRLTTHLCADCSCTDSAAAMIWTKLESLRRLCKAVMIFRSNEASLTAGLTELNAPVPSQYCRQRAVW